VIIPTPAPGQFTVVEHEPGQFVWRKGKQGRSARGNPSGDALDSVT
jgi:hypothetical protein